MTLEKSLPERVLVVAANYWPEESGSAPYTTGLAEDLAAHGSSVTVLAAMPYYPGWRIRDGYRGHLRLREERNGVSLVRSWLWVPGHQSALQRAALEGSFLLDALCVGQLARPQVVIGATPTLSGGVLARLFARRFHVPYGLVAQDLVGPGALQSGVRGGGRVAGLVRSAESWAMRRAARIAVVSPGFIPYLRELGVQEERIEHIRNWCSIPKSAADPAEVRARLGLPKGTPIVVHAGAMGLKQGLEQVVDAARLDQERGAAWCFVLAGDGSQRRTLRQHARDVSNVLFLPQQPVTAYADLLVAADILLVSERPGMLNMSLPGKLTAYLAAGRPVVAAVPPDGATASEIERSGAGVLTPAGRPDLLLAALDGFAADPTSGASLERAGPRYAADVLDEGRCLAQYRAFVSGLLGG